MTRAGFPVTPHTAVPFQPTAFRGVHGTWDREEGGLFRGATFGVGAHGMTACVGGHVRMRAHRCHISEHTYMNLCPLCMHSLSLIRTHARNTHPLTYTRRAKALQRHTTKKRRAAVAAVADRSQPARPSHTCRFSFSPAATSRDLSRRRGIGGGGMGGLRVTGYWLLSQHPIPSNTRQLFCERVRTSQASTTGGGRAWGSASSDPTSHTEALS